MVDVPGATSVLDEVQQTLQSIFQQTSTPADLVALAEEIRKYDREIGKQKTTTGLFVVGANLMEGNTLTSVEANLVTAFKTAVQAGKDLTAVIGLAKEIRKYEHDINKKNKPKKPAPSGELL